MLRYLALLTWIGPLACAQAGAELHNGIRLPAPWPPPARPLTVDAPADPPYLLSPPAVIPIDTGRQLFIDDFLVADTDLTRTFHAAEYWAGNPVLRPDQPWEMHAEGGTAMVFSDGVWYDPRDRLFKMWYMGVRATLYAASPDGVHWDKPALDVRPGTNIVHEGSRDSAAVWLDLEEPDPRRRFKFLYSSGHMKPLVLHESADGIHWGEPVARSVPWNDRTTFFRDPFRRMWVFSLRDDDREVGRMRRYWEDRDLAQGLKRLERAKAAPWIGADRLDARRIDLNVQPQLYNLDAVAYESLMLGLFSIWRGQPADRGKPNEVLLGFSRDGYHWDRPWRRAFIPVFERQGDWNWTNVQSAGGGCLIVGDRLYFYVSGRAGLAGSRASGIAATGLATLRRDGFASMDAGASGGSLTTRPVRFQGRRLFVNADAAGGELRVEVLGADGAAIAPFTRSNCVAVRQDNTLREVRWRGAEDLSAVAGKPVRFRFHLRSGKLYSFWISQDAEGASRGYVAAGGPGLTGALDTAGAAAYRNCCKPGRW